MIRRLAVIGIGLLAAASTMLADFTYEQTSTMTGGAMMAMMKVVGAFSKQAREPIKTTHIVKGDKMATITPQNAHIIDLAAETITEIDFQKKQYSVMTFAEMKQMMDELARKMKTGQGEANFKVSADATGQSKKINGYDARQMVIKMVMESTDPKSGQKGEMNIVTDSWLASGIAGYKEVQEFQKKMAAKLNWSPGGGGMMMNRPDMAKGMAAAAAEMAKLDGVPILQIVRMGGSGNMTPEQRQQMAEAQQRQAAQPQQQQQPQAERPSAGSALGGALGGRLGRFGGLGKKKEQPKQEEAPAQQQQPAAQSAPAAGGPAADPGVLMEMTIEMTGFAAGPADGSKFEVPAGFKKVAKK